MLGFRLILFGTSASALFGCGVAPQADGTARPDAGAFVEIAPAVNVCPVFDRALIIPLDIAPDMAAAIVVKATDPDGSDSALVYRWSSASGTFSALDRPTTAYRCSGLGPRVLDVSAEDVRGCSSHLELDVNCIAP